MAKDDNMPTKKEMIQFLERVEQLNEDDNVFKEKLGGLLRKIVGKTATQNDTSPIRHDTKSENHLLSNSKLTELEQRIHAIQQDNDNLGQKITQYQSGYVLKKITYTDDSVQTIKVLNKVKE